MPDVQKVSVALTGEQVAALKEAVALGEYATTSEIVREAIREWQWKREFRGEELERLRGLLMEADRSGPGKEIDFDAVREEARRRLKKAMLKRA
jgi:antitoxin ParD1/3/4